MAYTQENRRIAVTTPLGEDVLLLNNFSGRDAVSELFRFHLDMVSENDSIDFEQMVGKKVTVRITLADGSPRYWNGYVSRFEQAGRDQI